MPDIFSVLGGAAKRGGAGYADIKKDERHALATRLNEEVRSKLAMGRQVQGQQFQAGQQTERIESAEGIAAAREAGASERATGVSERAEAVIASGESEGALDRTSREKIASMRGEKKKSTLAASKAVADFASKLGKPVKKGGYNVKPGEKIPDDALEILNQLRTEAGMSLLENATAPKSGGAKEWIINWLGGEIRETRPVQKPEAGTGVIPPQRPSPAPQETPVIPGKVDWRKYGRSKQSQARG